MRIEHFSELDCWKMARTLVKEIYALTNKESFKKDFGLKDQIQRSAVSIMANIAEGFGTKSNIEFSRFITIALRSGFETQSHLYIALDLEYISKNEFTKTETLINNCVNLCKGFILYLNRCSKPPSPTY